VRRRGGVLVALAVLAAAACVSLASAKSTPLLRITGRAPVTVAGAHFSPSERVKVRLGPLLKVVRATSVGSFVARFRVTSDPCNDTLLVTAVGAAGDTARVKALARMCPPSP
jgi:hypothetical protein